MPQILLCVLEEERVCRPIPARVIESSTEVTTAKSLDATIDGETIQKYVSEMECVQTLILVSVTSRLVTQEANATNVCEHFQLTCYSRMFWTFKW
jgi:hypothetical protein